MLVVAHLDVNGDHRLAARRLRLDAVELAELLAGDFDRIRDLFGDFLRAGPRIRGDDHRRLDRELRVLEPAELAVGHDPTAHGEQHGYEHNAVISDGEDAGVHDWPLRARRPGPAPSSRRAGT